MSDNGNGSLLCAECGRQLKDVISYKKLRQTHDYLKKIHDATNEAVRKQGRINDGLQAVNKVVVAQRESANKNLEIQKQIVRDALAQHAAEKSGLESEIMKLRGVIRNGDHSRLGK